MWGRLGPPAARGPGARSAVRGGREGEAASRAPAAPGSPTGDTRVTGEGALVCREGGARKPGTWRRGRGGAAAPRGTEHACAGRARPPPLPRCPPPLPVASLKFGPIVRAFRAGAPLRAAGRRGTRRSRAGDPGCGRTPERREGPPGATGRGSRGPVWYLGPERRCRLALHNTGREGEAGGGRVGGESGREKLCFLLESACLWAAAAVMGPGGRGEACALTPGGETRSEGMPQPRRSALGGRRRASPRWLMGRRGTAGCRREEARHAREEASPCPLRTSMRQGAAGPRGRWRRARVGSGQGPRAPGACDRARPGRRERAMRGPRARGCVCVHTRRAPGAYLYL